MEKKQTWNYCVVGNIVKAHLDDNGMLRNGTPAYPGGARVYLRGKQWDSTQKEIVVLGLTRGKRYQAHEVPTTLIENVRCAKAYIPRILDFMGDPEYSDSWWGCTEEDRASTEAFVERWNASAAAALPAPEESAGQQYALLTRFIPLLKEDRIGEWVFDKENDGSIEHPKRAPYVRYSETVNRFVDALIKVTKDSTPRGAYYDYIQILQDSGITWPDVDLGAVDVSVLPGKTIIAMMNTVVARERFGEGLISRYMKNGTIVRWLERLKELDDYISAFSPEKDLPLLFERVDQMSFTLMDEVDGFLSNGIPATPGGISSLFDSFSVDHRSIYKIDLLKLWNYLSAFPDEPNDELSEMAAALQSVVDRMHVVCTLKDDVFEMPDTDYGGGDELVPRYTLLNQLATQNHNLAYARSRMNGITKEHSDQLSLFDFLDDEEENSNSSGFTETSFWELEDPSEKRENAEGICQDSEGNLWREFIFSDAYNAISDILTYYCEEHSDSKWASYKKRVLDELRRFAEDGKVEGFCFSIDYRYGDELRYFGFTLSDEELNLSDGGSVYSPDVGGDSFTNWDFTLWRDGTHIGNLHLDVDVVFEFISSGAVLSIEDDLLD